MQRFVQEKISSFIPGTIEWKSIDLSFSKICLTIHDVRLYTQDHQEVFSAARVSADVDFSGSSEKKELVFSSIEIDSLKLNAKADEDGEFDIVQALVDPAEFEEETEVSSGLPFNIRAKRIKITDGRLNVSIPDHKVQVASGRLDVLVSDVDIQKRQARLVLDLSDTALQFSEINQKLTQLQLEINLEDSVLKIVKANVSAFEQTMSVTMSGRIKDQSLFLSNFKAIAKKSVVQGHGRYDFDTNSFDSQISVLAQDINDFTAIFGLPSRGRLSVEGKIFGNLERPRADLDIKADHISIKETQVDFLNASLRIADEPGDLKGNLRIKSEGLKISQVNIGNVDADADLSHGLLSLKRVSVKNHQSVIDLSGKIHLFEAQTNTLVSNPDMDIQLKGGTVFLSDFFKDITGNLSAAGRVKGKADDFTGHVDLKADRIKAKNFQINRIDMALTGNGTFNDPHIQGYLDARGMILEKEKLAPLTLKLEADKHKIYARGSFGFDVSGSYQIDSQVFDAKMQLDSVPLAPYFKMAGQEDFSGSVKGIITARGSLDKLHQISAQASLSDLLVFFRKKEAVRADTVELSLNQGKLNLPGTKILLFEKAVATVSGHGQSSESVSIHFNTDFPMALIDPVFEQIDQVTGRVVVNAQFDGDITSPGITGQIQLVDLGMALSYIDDSFKQINGNIIVDQNMITVDQIKGFLGEGDFFANGQVKISGMNVESGQIVFETHQFPLNFPDLMDLTINSRLLLKGNREKSNLTGEIVLLEGRYYKDVKLDVVHMAQKTRTIQPVKEKKKPSFLDNMALDIGVTRREPFLVENNLATLQITPDLRVAGIASNPLLNGRAQVDSGVVKFQKKEFEVKKGIIDFVNPYRIAPVIDLEGSVDIRTWTINMAVLGPPENLDFKFSSNPPEQQADIVSLLAFGKTTRELRTSQGGSNFSPAQILSGFVADTVKKNLKDISGLDYVELGVTGDGEKEGYGGQVTVGKDLSRQLTVKYGVDARSGETVQRVTTDYKILENLLMSGYQDSVGDFGGALKYRLEFR